MDHMRCLSVDHRDGQSTKKPQCHKSLRRIVEAIILEGESGAFKDPWGVSEVEAVIAEVRLKFCAHPT